MKSIYLAASYLKMDRIAAQCSAHLLESLTPESCLEIRGLTGITNNEPFVRQVDAYIRQHVSFFLFYSFIYICRGRNYITLRILITAGRGVQFTGIVIPAVGKDRGAVSDIAGDVTSERFESMLSRSRLGEALPGGPGNTTNSGC